MSDLIGKAKDAVGGDKGEQVSDAALDKGVNIADDKTGGDHDAQIDKVRDAADAKIGD